MEAVTGIFPSQSEANQAVEKLRSSGVSAENLTLLVPGNNIPEELKSVPVDATEQPGMGKAIGAVLGGAAGLSGGLLAAFVPGVGMVTALGLLGAAALTAAGATVGAVAGGTLENSTTKGLPEDEIFVYEDALRKGRSVVIAMADGDSEATSMRIAMEEGGAEAVDAARDEWWIGLRSAEKEHYLQAGKDLDTDETFFRMGFEAALHSRMRCMEFDQVSSEMANRIDELEKRYPNSNVAELYTRGYQRGREYYQRTCDKTEAA